MTILAFPPVETADEYGLLAVGGDVEVESLLLAYRSGIFPWPIAGVDVLTWFSPPTRAVLFLDEVHLGRSLRKKARRHPYRIAVDTDFEGVIRGCATSANRAGTNRTWITDELIEGYIALHRAGHAHSIECYDTSGRLVGGLYGVAIGAMFAGESMFYRAPDASKLALLWLIDHLRSKGAGWIDCQQMTPLLERFGAAEIARERFLPLLHKATSTPVRLFA